MLPQHADEHEDGGDEDEGQGNLADGAGGKGFDVALGAALVGFLVPAGEGGEQEEADEGEDDGDDAVGCGQPFARIYFPSRNVGTWRRRLTLGRGIRCCL